MLKALTLATAETAWPDRDMTGVYYDPVKKEALSTDGQIIVIVRGDSSFDILNKELYKMYGAPPDASRRCILYPKLFGMCDYKDVDKFPLEIVRKVVNKKYTNDVNERPSFNFDILKRTYEILKDLTNSKDLNWIARPYAWKSKIYCALLSHPEEIKNFAVFVYPVNFCSPLEEINLSNEF
jgi:hypothetical protein